jgi:hypothetical protein
LLGNSLVGCSRQNIRKLMITHPATFPVAVHEGTQAFWHLRPVLLWFSETQKHAIDRVPIEVSEVTMNVNIAKKARRLPGAGFRKNSKRCSFDRTRSRRTHLPLDGLVAGRIQTSRGWRLAPRFSLGEAPRWAFP